MFFFLLIWDCCVRPGMVLNQEAAVNRCPRLRIILRDPGFTFELWVFIFRVGVSFHTELFRLFFVTLLFIVLFSVLIKNQDEHLPRCVLVRSLLLLRRRGRGEPLHHWPHGEMWFASSLATELGRTPASF
jgi:hypothetical protein